MEGSELKAGEGGDGDGHNEEKGELSSEAAAPENVLPWDGGQESQFSSRHHLQLDLWSLRYAPLVSG